MLVKEATGGQRPFRLAITGYLQPICVVWDRKYPIQRHTTWVVVSIKKPIEVSEQFTLDNIRLLTIIKTMAERKLNIRLIKDT